MNKQETWLHYDSNNIDLLQVYKAMFEWNRRLKVFFFMQNVVNIICL